MLWFRYGTLVRRAKCCHPRVKQSALFAVNTGAAALLCQALLVALLCRWMLLTPAPHMATTHAVSATSPSTEHCVVNAQSGSKICLSASSDSGNVVVVTDAYSHGDGVLVSLMDVGGGNGDVHVTKRSVDVSHAQLNVLVNVNAVDLLHSSQPLAGPGQGGEAPTSTAAASSGDLTVSTSTDDAQAVRVLSSADAE